MRLTACSSDINYEGCKGWFNGVVVYKVPRQILTMRDVKWRVIESVIDDYLSQILTMRDVKKNSCYHKSLTLLCQILTMRDVKVKLEILKQTKNTVRY